MKYDDWSHDFAETKPIDLYSEFKIPETFLLLIHA